MSPPLLCQPLSPPLSQHSFLFPTMPLNPPLNQVSLPSCARAAHVSGLVAILASQNKLSLMGVRQGELRGRRGECEERAVKTHRMLLHTSPYEQNSGITASDISAYTKSNSNIG